MRFDVTKPCPECPFLRESPRAVRLIPSRVCEVAGNMLDPQGGTFTCHKAIHGREDDGSYQPGVDDIHCVGALIFALVNDNWTRMMEIAHRFDLFDPDQFRSEEQQSLVFANIEEMLKTALPARR